MKTFITLILIFCSCNFLFGQDFTLNINNKGNRLQTYPKVTEINPEILEMINQVSIPNLENDIQWMQDLGCRDAQSNEALQTQNWLVDKFEALGLNVYIHFFPCRRTPYLGSCTPHNCNGDTLDAGNVVAIQHGTKFPNEIIIVSSHYDHPDGPGADDNASGTAGVLETARILSQYQFDRTIMYVPFNGEEYWMVGSMPFAQKCAMEDLNILGVFNLDMIGFFPEGMGAITMSAGASPISMRLWEYFFTVANLYVPDVPTFRLSAGDCYGGDHMPFNIYEFPALYIGDIEYHHLHPCYHKLCDTIGNGVNSFELVEAFVKATTASIAELANGYLPPQNFSAIPSENSIYLSWDEVENTTYKVFRDDVLIAEISENNYTDIAVAQNTEYEYFVTGIRDDDFESAESNHDFAKASVPLTLPYNNSFETEEDLSDFRFYGEPWLLSSENPQSGGSSITNTTATTLSDNYLTLVELQWLSIPDTVTNISLRFYYRGILFSGWYNANYNVNFFVEITTDRKKWDKLLKISGHNTKPWEQYEASLNDYIGSDFVQIRFRLESSGSDDYTYVKRIFLDNISLGNLPVQAIEKHEVSKLSDVHIFPNPSEGIFTITTGLDESYNIVVYNVSGNKVYEIDNFNDGQLNLNHLSQGVYYIKINTGNNSLAKKIVVMGI